MNKVEVFPIGISTPFKDNKAVRVVDNVYKISNPLKEIWDYRQKVCTPEEGSLKVDHLFGRVHLPSDKEEILLSGNYFPIDWKNPVVVSKKGSLNLDSCNRGFEGFVRAYDYEIKSQTIPKIVLLQYNYSETMNVRGWFKVERKDFSNTIKFKLISNRDMSDKSCKINWSDRLPG